MRGLKNFSTFGIGGKAKILLEAKSVEELQAALIKYRDEKERVLILGKGSNVLFDDRGFDGVVILNKIDFLQDRGEGVFVVGGGCSFSFLGVKTARKGWSGLEFACGIPGSVGGAVFMNAGSGRYQTCDVLLEVDYMRENGELLNLYRDDLDFAYRTSSFQKMQGSIVSAMFALQRCEGAWERALDLLNDRKSAQPYGEMSAGCIFRNPPEKAAGALIEEAGLKGMTLGGAQVSSVHANFIVNRGTATCRDVLSLIEEVERQVKAKTGIALEREVRYIPYTAETAE